MGLRAEAAHVAPETANLQVYRDPKVVSHYASLEYLTACERLLFDTHLKRGSAILDIGVGGGRTSPYLSGIASRYLGVDYSEEMVRTCRIKFPELDFRVADASDLSVVPDTSFDAIVIAFNGLDYLFPDERRRQCLRECGRVLRSGGMLVFSSHNPQSIFVRPAWIQARVRAFAGRMVSEQSVLFGVTVFALTVAKAVHSGLRAIVESVRRILRRVSKAAFWRGEGYVFDPVHGGCTTHSSTPAWVREELTRFGFQQVAVLGDDYPKNSYRFVTDWYYYVFSKMEKVAGEPCV